MTEFKAPPVPPTTVNEGHEEPVSAPEVPQNFDATETAAPAQESSTEEQQPNHMKLDILQGNVRKLQEKTAEMHQQFNAMPDSKKHIILYLAVFMLGFFLGGVLFHGGSAPTEVLTKDLQGVVPNPDIKEKLKRCGMVSPSSPCVLYVMNSYDYDKLAEDFFETAVALTKRTDFLIRSENVRYSKMRIPPGYFAIIKIPIKR